jgi:two-component system cell cycle sensor histidine kinase/response regulator CckA
LGSVNYKVLAAANGQEALSIFDKKQGKVDLVISDMVMPIMDGARLYSALKERKSDIKMIIITGYPLERGGKEFLKQGVVAYIQKPLQVETVILAVRDALDNLGKDHSND